MKYLILFILFCLSFFTYGQTAPSKSDTIPLTINKENTVFVKAIFNDKDTLNLNFDTGTTELVLTDSTIQHKLNKAPKLYNSHYNLKIGTKTYKPLVFDAKLSGHGTDGRFGWDLFKNNIVELNYDKGFMIIHSSLPNYVKKDKKISPLKIEFWKDIFFVKTSIIQNGITNTESFLFDLGYNRTVILDNDLLLRDKFPIQKMDILKETVVRGAQGNEIKVVTSNLKTLKIGKYKLKNVPAQVLTSSKPLKGKNMHILGNEVLKRFNIILDFQENVVYLKPNHLLNDRYIDSKKTES